MDQILSFLGEHREEMIADLRRFVELETPSTDKSLLDGFAEFLAGYAETTTGGLAEVLENEAGGNHVRVRCGGDEPPIMLLGHFDTVWPAGTIETMPFSVRDGIASGPGVFDMKCGLVQGFWAVRSLREALGIEKSVVLSVIRTRSSGARVLGP